MTEKLLSSGDVCSIASLEPHVFNDWCVKGIVKPVEGGTKQGDHRRFAPMQVVGIAVAAELRRGERGCVLSYVGKVVDAFGAMSEAWLAKKFAKGETHFVMVHQDKPLLDGDDRLGPNVRAIYEVVKAASQQE